MKRTFLPMLGIPEQIPGRGAMTTSFTQVDSVGRERAIRLLFDKVIEQLNRRSPPHDPINDLDDLKPDKLQAALHARLATLDELTEPRAELPELEQRLDTLTVLYGAGICRIGRDAQAHAQAVVQNAAQKFRESLEKALLARPGDAPALIEQARTALSALPIPDHDPQPLQRLKRIVRAAADLKANHTALPRSAFDRVLTLLQTRGRSAYEQALDVYAGAVATQQFRLVAADLHAFLNEQSRRIAVFLQRSARIRELLADTEKQAAERFRISRASVILGLRGPEENEILSSMMQTVGCSDINRLAMHALTRLEQHVLAFTQARCPAAATLPHFVLLLAAIEPEDAADLFVETVESCLGRGHTFYEIVEQYGIGRCAWELYCKAEPTCDLGGRNSERFNVPSVQLTIVRLPRTIGPRDNELRERLRSAFDEIDRCIFAPEDGADGVVVCRLEVGYPIALDRTNTALAERYAESARQGHFPHLLNVLPDSEFGEACSKYLRMLEN